MENYSLVLPLTRGHYKDRKHTNLNLDKVVVREATKQAADRYGWSLSELANQLLKEEVRVKGGLLSFALGRKDDRHPARKK